MRRLRIAVLLGVALAMGLAGAALMMSGHDESVLIAGNAQVKAGEQITSWDAAVVQLDRVVPGTPKNARRFATVYVMFNVGPERIERRLRLTHAVGQLGGKGRLALITKAVGVRGVIASPRCVKARFSVGSALLLAFLAGSLVDASEPHEMQPKESVYLPARGACRTILIEVDV